MSSTPNNPHDCVLWLFQTLVGVRDMGDGLFKGRLPEGVDFTEVVEDLERRAGQVIGYTNSASREVEFYPIPGHVYQTVEQLVGIASNQIRVPERFTVRELGYTGPGEDAPASIRSYVESVQLWALLSELADHVVPVPAALHFIESPTMKVELTQGFTAAQAARLTGVDEFSRDFVRTDLHRNQKRDIVRGTLISVLGGVKRATLGQFMEKFEEFLSGLKASYATFAADFSYKKVRDEVDKQNLDDMLRLNKTLADIQNQLLALPAALILASAGLEAGKGVKNLAIVIGVTIFAVLMVALVSNQRNSVAAIEQEVNFRRQLINAQPPEFSSTFKDSFKSIEQRVRKQRANLKGVLSLVAVVWFCVVGLAVYQYVAQPALKDHGEKVASTRSH